MKQTLSERLTDRLVSSGGCAPEDREIVAYGLYAGMILAVNILTSALIGVWIGAPLESLAFLAVFSFVRTYTGGAHSSSPVVCYFISCGAVALVLLICRHALSSTLLPASLILMGLSAPVILKLAPVETPNKPLDDVEHQHYRKTALRRCAVVAILWIILCYFGQYRWCLLLSLAAALMSVLLVVGVATNHARR